MDDVFDLDELFERYPAQALDAQQQQQHAPHDNEKDEGFAGPPGPRRSVASDDLFDTGDEGYNMVGSDMEEDGSDEPSSERPERITFNNNSSGSSATTSEDLSEYYTAPYKDNDFTHIVEEGSPNPRYCFFCECGQSTKDWLENKLYNDLVEFFNDNFHRMSSHALCAKGQTMYNKTLRYHTPLKLPWYQSIIWEHITDHAASPRVMYELSLKQHNNILHVLSENACFRRNQNNPRDIKLHFDSVKLFLLATEKRNTILRHVHQMRGAAKGL